MKRPETGKRWNIRVALIVEVGGSDEGGEDPAQRSTLEPFEEVHVTLLTLPR